MLFEKPVHTWWHKCKKKILTEDERSQEKESLCVMYDAIRDMKIKDKMRTKGNPIQNVKPVKDLHLCS